jgi:hypothetical protein
MVHKKSENLFEAGICAKLTSELKNYLRVFLAKTSLRTACINQNERKTQLWNTIFSNFSICLFNPPPRVLSCIPFYALGLLKLKSLKCRFHTL